MRVQERFVILVPALVTVIVVLVVDHGSSVHGGLLPFLGRTLSNAWHFLYARG